MSIVAGVDNLIRPMTVISLSHSTCASTFVYYTTDVTRRFDRPRQLRIGGHIFTVRVHKRLLVSFRSSFWPEHSTPWPEFSVIIKTGIFYRSRCIFLCFWRFVVVHAHATSQYFWVLNYLTRNARLSTDTVL